MNQRPIGIFDSGSGGLTVVRQVARLLPRENILYVGDTARLPYGHRGRDEIILFNRQIISWLIGRGAKMIILGCNTSSALALDWARQNYDLPILGLIEAGANGAREKTKNKSCGVLATQATADSHAYQRAIASRFSDITVIESACPLLVPLIESGQVAGPAVIQAARQYLAPLLSAQVDTIIYGCTHYPLLESVLKSIAGPGVTFIDPASFAVKQARKILAEKKLAKSAGPVSYKFYVTGPRDNFEKTAALVLPGLGYSLLPLALSDLERLSTVV